MKNAIYVDQCNTIPTLTEEEMAVVSGGVIKNNNDILAMARRFESRPISYYVPRRAPSYGWGNAAFALSFLF